MSDKKLFGKYTPPIYDEHYAAVKNEDASECPSGADCSIALPVITPDVFEEFAGLDYLIESDNGESPQWAQTAVDFACLLKSHCKQ